MTKKILQTTLILVVLLSSTSCNKWLDLQPQDGITKQEFWKTKEDVKAALTGIYSSMIAGGVEQRIFLWGELRADMIDLTVYASEDFKQVRNSNILTTNRISYWGDIYDVINNCNLLIDFAGDAKKLDPTFTDALYNDYVGEALAVRSLMYFYLVRSFRDVPLKLKGTYRDKDIVEIGLSTEKQVLTQIIADLNKAKTMVPRKVSTVTEVNKGRITKPAVYAILADVYLWNQQYQECVDATDSVLINNPDLKLIPNSKGWFLSVFEEGSSSETIFELNHKNLSNVFYTLLADSRRAYTASQYVTTNYFAPNTLVDTELSDGRSGFFNTGLTILKHGKDNPNYYNFQVYRISDVQLMQAEALNQIGEGAKALAIVENIRTQRDALDATQPVGITADNKDGIDLFILEERAREFAFEGKRWFDILRNAKRDNYANQSLLNSLITDISDASIQQSALNKIKDPNSHYFPILESELFADTKLVQNPFYLK